MFDTAKNALDPYINAGQGVLPTLQNLLTPGPSQTATLSQLPGFQFQSQWGNLAATNQLAAQGLGGSGGPLGKALSDYNQGLAGTYWQNEVGGLQNFANMGLSGGNALAGNAIQAGNIIGNTQQNQGNALAAGTLGSSNAIAGGIQNAGGSAVNALLLNKVLGSGGTQGIFNTDNSFVRD